MVAYVQLSPAISMPVSGALCESDLSWPSVFYGHALVTSVLFFIFMVSCIFSLKHFDFLIKN